MTDPRRAAPAATLHALLGVSEDIGATDLRMAYDRAMATAVRMTDTRHALALSQAFDALPGAVRDRVYPAVQHRRAPVEPGGAGTRRTRPGRRGLKRTRSAGGRRVPRRRWGRRRIVILLAVLALAVAAGVVVALHWHDWLQRPDHGSDRGLRLQPMTVVQQVPGPQTM